MHIGWEADPRFDKVLLELAKEKLTQRKIAEEMAGRFGLGFTRNSIKNRLDHIQEKGYIVHRETEIDSTEELFNPQKNKREVSHNALLVTDALKGELKGAKPYKRLEKNSIHVNGDTMIIHLTDWHVGKVIRDEFGAIIYDEKISQIRINWLFNQILSLLDLHIRQGTPIKNALIMITGDLPDGMGIYATQQTQSELAPPFQVMVVIKYLQQLVLSLLERKLAVDIKAVKGNHGEIRESGKEVDPLANWDIMVFLVLDFWMRSLGNKNVSLEYSQLDYLNFKVQGWKFHIRHYAPVQPETPAGKSKFLGWYKHHQFNAFAYGHWHHYGLFDVSTIPVFRGGSLTGMDEFSEELASESDPMQLVFGVNKKRPLSFLYPCDLGRKGQR